jgi:hypothetical protein
MKESKIAQDSFEDDGRQIHTSVLLRRLVAEAPSDYFTLSWLVGYLPKRSFGVILLFLAMIAILPVISIPARFLIIILTAQIILGYRAPALPSKWMERHLRSSYLQRLQRHAIPALEHIEIVVKPRWPILLTTTRRFSAFIAMLLTLLSLIAPFPLSNVPPDIICVLMALAYTEHDGFLLIVALVLALMLLAAVFLAILGAYKI